MSVGGLASSTVTEGITTDVTTTATTIPFGRLSFNTNIEGAQRLTVSTNATQGYQVFVFGRADLLNELAAAIPGVAGTNDTPLAWATGCYATSSGCYAYHAGDDTLSGVATRFAANDTFAKLVTSTKEVAYSSIPVTNEITDMVFRARAQVEQQPGSYTSTLGYVVVPTF
jgi:hypothetical protein